MSARAGFGVVALLAALVACLIWYLELLPQCADSSFDPLAALLEELQDLRRVAAQRGELLARERAGSSCSAECTTTAGDWLERRGNSSCAGCRLWRLPRAEPDTSRAGRGAPGQSSLGSGADKPTEWPCRARPFGAALPPRGLRRRCTREPGVNIPGHDLDSPMPSKGIDECAARCADDPRCNGFAMRIDSVYTAGSDVGRRPEAQQLDGHGPCWLKTLPVPFGLEKSQLRHFRRSEASMVSGECMYVTKLVVNSHVGSAALPRLFHSLYSVAFTRFSDIIVVLGDAQKNTEPSAVPVRELLPIPEDDVVVVVGVERHNYDMHGFAALGRHREHPLVAAHGYMYIHCSSTVDPKFTAMFDRLDFSDPLVVYATPCPSSNIYAFGAGVVDAYGSSYEEPLGKLEGLLIEHGRGIVRGVRPLPLWGHARPFGRRDLLGTGRDGRLIVSYTDFGIIKYIKWGPSPPACNSSWGCVPFAPECLSSGRGCKDC